MERVQRCSIGQIELWESKKFVNDYKPLIKEVFNSFDHNKWFFNAPCISMGKTYVLTEDEEIRNILETNFGFVFDNEAGESEKLIERKEFVKVFLDL